MKKTTLGPFLITPYVKERLTLKFQALFLLGSVLFSFLIASLRHPEGVDLQLLVTIQMATYAIFMSVFIGLRVLYDTVMGDKGN